MRTPNEIGRVRIGKEVALLAALRDLLGLLICVEVMVALLFLARGL